jgi:hypothetical protein
MFALNELREHIDAYVSGARPSLSELYDWFEENSFDAYEDQSLREACVALDTAFSEYFFDGIAEEVLKVELAKAVRPFVSALHRLIDYLAGTTSLDALEDWSAEASADIHNNPDQEARELIYAIRGLLNRHADDDSEDELKRDLIEVISPSSFLPTPDLEATVTLTELVAA